MTNQIGLTDYFGHGTPQQQLTHSTYDFGLETQLSPQMPVPKVNLYQPSTFGSGPSTPQLNPQAYLQRGDGNEQYSIGFGTKYHGGYGDDGQ